MLPRIPHKQTKRAQEIVAFRGMNRTQNTQDGDILNAQNLSTAEYPTVTQRGKRTLVPKYINPQDHTDVEYYNDPTDIYAWDGHLIVVDSGILYLDGAPMINVSQGKKQFAVINTKLCIWPDKLYIDLAVTGSDVPGGTYVADGTAYTIEITHNTFSTIIATLIQQGRTNYISEYSGAEYTYTYGTDMRQVSSCWYDGAWNMEALAELQQLTRVGDDGIVGKIIILDGDNQIVHAYSEARIDTSRYNQSGYFGVVTRRDPEAYGSRITFDLYRMQLQAPLFSTVFHVGDGVSFAGMPNGADVGYALIRAIDNATNTMTFDDNTFSVSGSFSNVVTIRRVANTGFGHLDASVRTSGDADSIDVTETTFTADLTALVQDGMQVKQSGWIYRLTIFAYGTNVTDFMQCWDNGAWDMEALAELQQRKTVLRGGDQLSVGDIFIPSKTGDAYDLVYAMAGDPDTSRYNTDGYYGVVTNIQNTTGWDDWSEVEYDITYVTFDVYNANQIMPLFSESFRVGDTVSISGTKDGAADVEHAIIRAINVATNTLTFDPGTFDVPPGYDTSDQIVTIKRDVPSLDYICEKDNRLWGVSNSLANSIYNPGSDSYETYTARAIYASALGDPTNWWTFDGIDSDSFQVAVGSEGDFTGICAYGNAVCCWKEDALHKILGSFPSEYYMHTSHIEGVAKGSSRSLTVVNETLYYNGATGIYAYTGSTPSLIGYPLGTLYKDVSAGSNGLRWYFSGTKPDGSKELVVYDLTHRIWTREDDSDAVAFAMIGSNLYILNHYDDTFNRIWLVEQGGDPDVEWSAEFVPFDETELIRKHYLRIALRLDMAAGSHVTVEVSMDNGEWRMLLEDDAQAAKAKVVQIPPNRVDRFTVRVSGTGNVRIREFMREFIPGSERP